MADDAMDAGDGAGPWPGPTLGSPEPSGASGADALECGTDGAPNCTAAGVATEDWVESVVVHGVKVWHVLFIVAGAFCALVIVLCCCIRFRIPRTKQEIEADYVRKQITRKFRKQLRRIQNSDMDDMDLKRALDRVRAEFKSDTESLAQSITSSANASVCNSPGGPGGPDGLRGGGGGGSGSGTYRKASDIGVSIEDLIARRDSGLGARLSSLVGRLRPRRGSSASVAGLGSGLGLDAAASAACPQQQPSSLRTIEAEP